MQTYININKCNIVAINYYICIMRFSNLHQHLDKMGIGVSLLCAIHCAVLPLIMTTLPLLGLEFFGSAFMESLIILLSLVIGITSLVSSVSQHKKRLPLYIMLCGFVAIFAGHFLVSGKAEWILLAMGGLAVATAHYINWQLVKRCSVSALSR